MKDIAEPFVAKLIFFAGSHGFVTVLLQGCLLARVQLLFYFVFNMPLIRTPFPNFLEAQKCEDELRSDFQLSFLCQKLVLRLLCRKCWLANHPDVSSLAKITIWALNGLWLDTELSISGHWSLSAFNKLKEYQTIGYTAFSGLEVWLRNFCDSYVITELTNYSIVWKVFPENLLEAVRYSTTYFYMLGKLSYCDLHLCCISCRIFYLFASYNAEVVISETSLKDKRLEKKVMKFVVYVCHKFIETGARKFVT